MKIIDFPLFSPIGKTENLGESSIFEMLKFQIDRSRSSGGVKQLPWAFWNALYLYFTRAKFYGDRRSQKNMPATKPVSSTSVYPSVISPKNPQKIYPFFKILKLFC